MGIVNDVKTVFETGALAGDVWHLIPIIVAVGVLAVILGRRKDGKNVNWKIIAFCAVFALIGAIMLIQDIQVWHDLVEPYRRGRYLTAEGPVEDFVPAASKRNPRESFTVDGVPFVLGGEAEGFYGYDRTSLFGGAITENGMSVRICYIPYNGINVILRLDVEN